jgi:lysyl-tRNA synthetase class 2
MDPRVRNLVLRAEMLQAVRGFFNRRGYLEVETPVRIPVPLPEAHIEPFASEGWVLQPSPELCMKRLLAAGHRRIFQICKCFRKGERGRRHLPEMTLLEWYGAGDTYRDLMTETEALIGEAARALGLGGTIAAEGGAVDLAPPWPRMSVRDAFARYAPLSAEAALAAGRFDELMGLAIEPRLGRERPLFLVDYPAACGALARLKPEDPSVAERFELYIAGVELCNGFSELTDAAEQRRRFEAVLAAQGAAGRGLPEKFLAALETLPPCAGNALGIDRLAMLFAGAGAIDEVVAFPPEAL